MTELVVALAADHAGFELKQHLVEVLTQAGRQVLDLGTDGIESVDYPDFAKRMADCLRNGDAPLGVLICGTGIGISMAANRHPWVRAAPCGDVSAARLARRHNDANVLGLGARLIGRQTAEDMLDAFLTTSFDGGRHSRRIAKMSGEDG